MFSSSSNTLNRKSFRKFKIFCVTIQQPARDRVINVSIEQKERLILTKILTNKTQATFKTPVIRQGSRFKCNHFIFKV